MPPIRITRFAPSPTGRLHLGHVFAAAVAHDFARESNGRFLLRIEDIDSTRCANEYVAGIEEDLAWLGLNPDGEVIRQSLRTAAYAEAFARLQAMGVLYPCFCTRREILAEIAAIGGAPQGPDGPLYPGTCRGMTGNERAARLEHARAEGFEPAWRMDVAMAQSMTDPLTWHDIYHGEFTANPAITGDVVLARKELGTSYHLAVVVDDAWQAITLVTRGADLMPSTHIHCLLQALLGLPTPDYAHHPLVCDDQGLRLAKRHDALAVASLRAAGWSPEGVLSEARARVAR